MYLYGKEGERMFAFNMLLQNSEDSNLVEKLYNKYERMLYHYAIKILKNKNDAEDAVSETFLRIIKNISKLSDCDCLKTKGFLFVTLKNISFDILKDRKRSSEIAVDELDISAIEDVEITFFSRIRFQNLKKAFDKLPEQYREVLLFHVKYEMDINEIASAFGLSYGAAQRKLSRAKSRFKELIEEDNYEK